MTPRHNGTSSSSSPSWAVKYGASPDQLVHSAKVGAAEHYTYSRADGYYYESASSISAVMSDLQAASTVYYRIELASTTSTSETFSANFVVPHPGGSSESAVLAIIGDLGQTPNSSRTVQHVIAGMANPEPYEAAIIVGDLSYADAQATKCYHPGGCNQERWDTWGNMMTPLTSQLPFMTLPGNHEIEANGLETESIVGVTTTPFLSYSTRFRAVAANPLYYSWDLGPLHAIHLNSYDDQLVGDKAFSTSSAQYRWVAADLAAVNRTRTPWVAAFLHAPWYNSNTAHQNEVEESKMKALLEPLFHQYGVELLFAGHVHAYERTLAVYKEEVNAEGITEINIGDGGNREGPASGFQPQPKWSAYREASFGHGRLHIYNDSHAHFSWHKNAAGETQVSDDIWLVKHKHMLSASSQGVATFDYQPGGLGEAWVSGREQHDTRRHGDGVR
jgi:hypothetical protein